MKKILLICLLSLACFTIQAQIISLSETEVDANFQDVDLTNNWENLITRLGVTNLTDETVQLKWEREISPECNEVWETSIMDNGTDYLPWVDTNIGPSSNGSIADVPFVLEANETFDNFVFFIYPHMNTGCCEMKMHFSLADKPDSILATATYDVNVNMNYDCNGLTSNQEIEAAKSITAFPSPTADFFELSENEVVRQIGVYNSVGQLVKTMNYINGTSYDLSNEVNGLYFLQLKNEEGANLKLLPLVKGSK